MSPLRHHHGLLLRSYHRYKHRLWCGKRDYLHGILGDRLYYRLRCWLDILPVLGRYPDKGVFYPCLKSVVLVFNGDVLSVGLADRLRAICSVYYWCKKNQITFKVHFTHPFKLSDYLLPNQYDWETGSDELDCRRAFPKAMLSYSIIKSEPSLHRASLDAFLTGGHETIHLYSNTRCHDDFFHACFHELFRPSKRLEEELDGFLKQVGQPYISVSFRFAQLLGDLKDTFGRALPAEERFVLIDRCKRCIKKVVEGNAVKVALVTSDSQTFLNQLSDLPCVYIVPGSVGHIRNRVTEEQVRKTFWDLFMISHARKAYIIRTAQMYRSDFSRRGALIGHIPFEEIILD